LDAWQSKSRYKPLFIGLFINKRAIPKKTKPQSVLMPDWGCCFYRFYLGFNCCFRAVFIQDLRDTLAFNVLDFNIVYAAGLVFRFAVLTQANMKSLINSSNAFLLLIDDIDAVFTKNGLAIFCQLLNSDYFSTANLDARGDFALTRRDKFNM